jgi:carbonic anhydrase
MRKINKIFQIGFNKCGTVSLYHFFEDNGLKPIHWDMGMLATTIKYNHNNNLPLLKGYEKYDVFTDMENVHQNLYRTRQTISKLQIYFKSKTYRQLDQIQSKPPKLS